MKEFLQHILYNDSGAFLIYSDEELLEAGNHAALERSKAYKQRTSKEA